MTSATVNSIGSSKLHGRRPAADTAHSHIDKLLCREIDFIPSEEFDATDTVWKEELVDAVLGGTAVTPQALVGLPPHLRRLCEEELLTHEQETTLFRAMNFLKFKASLLRSESNGDCPDASAIAEIQSLLAKAQAIRDHIIKANMRLVMSIVKKFVTSQHSFDDMLSEGVFTLMQAVEKFDYSRGFRFSTYAYRSIARTAYRTVSAARKEAALITRDAEEWAFEQVDDRSTSPESEKVWSKLRETTASMLDRLDRRERFIVRSRYALGSHRKVRTFQFLADKLGVSKERVRQLEQRALGKLHTMADDIEKDELFGAAMS